MEIYDAASYKSMQRMNAKYNSANEMGGRDIKLNVCFFFQAVKQLLFNVLLFPDGGWLVDSTSGNDESCTPEDELREHQLEKLRELCIPKVTLLLHSVMSEMNEHDSCIQLADVLASEQYQLYKVCMNSKIIIITLRD